MFTHPGRIRRIFALLLCTVLLMGVFPASSYAISAPGVNVKNVSNGVSVTWSKVKGAKGYKVYRKAANSATYTLLKSLKANGKSYVDKKAAAGTSYTYMVMATQGEETQSASATIVRLPATKITEIKNTAVGVSLTWNKVAGAASYRIYRAAGKSKTYAQIASASSTTYIDMEAAAGKNSYYVVPVSGTTVGVASSKKTVNYKRTAKTYGDSGCLAIPEAGIAVPLYAGSSQRIVDAKESAAYFPFAGCKVVADHNYQNNFTGLYDLKQGAKLTILQKDGTSRTLTCVESSLGWNRSTVMTDNLGNSVTAKHPGSLIVYTCRGSFAGAGASSIHYTVWK